MVDIHKIMRKSKEKEPFPVRISEKFEYRSTKILNDYVSGVGALFSNIASLYAFELNFHHRLLRTII